MVRRSRTIYVLWMAAVILAGLASRHYASLLPRFLAKEAGDILWALTVFLFCGFLMPRWTTARAAAVALAISIADEVSQLYHAPWIDAIRRNFVGHLFLGDTFAWGDIGCYVVGVAAGALAEIVWFAQARKRAQEPL